MTKIELLEVINTLPENKFIVFKEQLDCGFENSRTMGCSKEHLTDIIETYFDDNLYGHVKDGVMTTIIGYEIIE